MIVLEITDEYVNLVKNTLKRNYPIEFSSDSFTTVRSTCGWDGYFFEFHDSITQRKYIAKVLYDVAYDSQEKFIRQINFSYSVYFEIQKRTPKKSEVRLPELFLNSNRQVLTLFSLQNVQVLKNKENSEEEEEEDSESSSDDEEEEKHAIVLFEFIEGKLISENMNSTHDEKIISFLRWIHQNSSNIIQSVSNDDHKKSEESEEIKPIIEEFDLSDFLKWGDYYLDRLPHLFDSSFLRTMKTMSFKFREKIVQVKHEILKDDRILKNPENQFVICHTDLHGENMIVKSDEEEEIIFIIDWDFTIYGPKERDLVFFKNRPKIMKEFFGVEGNKNIFFVYYDFYTWYLDFIVCLEKLYSNRKRGCEENIQHFKNELKILIEKGNKILGI